MLIYYGFLTDERLMYKLGMICKPVFFRNLFIDYLLYTYKPYTFEEKSLFNVRTS